MNKLWIPVALVLALGAAAGCMGEKKMEGGGMMKGDMSDHAMSDGGTMQGDTSGGMEHEGMSDGGM